jgi:hypothetical protein
LNKVNYNPKSRQIKRKDFAFSIKKGASFQPAPMKKLYLSEN